MKKNLLRLLRGTNTQAYMAKRYGVSQQCYQQWEAGINTPPLYTMLRVSKDYELPIDAIFFDKCKLAQYDDFELL